MKKILLTLLALCVASIYSFAGSDLKVVGGSKKFFRTAEGKAVLYIDWEGCQYDNRMALEENFTVPGELDVRKEAGYNGFIQDFNQKMRKMKIGDDDQGAIYEIYIKVVNLDQYIKVMSFMPGPATKIWGTITITDLTTGEVALVVNFEEVDGGASPSVVETWSDAFEELADQLCEL